MVDRDEPDIQQRTFAFAVRVVNLCKTLHQQDGIARILTRQVLRAGTSVGANVEEAQGAQSKADFTAKMSIAQKEARETVYWIRLIIEADVLPADRLQPLLEES